MGQSAESIILVEILHFEILVTWDLNWFSNIWGSISSSISNSLFTVKLFLTLNPN
uniref:Uncharacterized protein n=1 Tax=Rhizophagus irregularis (strain DAOM 181602 / DAOM 197198 / MUCL 43194) TaxID=747089 RepID=U9TVY3_RHIID